MAARWSALALALQVLLAAVLAAALAAASALSGPAIAALTLLELCAAALLLAAAPLVLARWNAPAWIARAAMSHPLRALCSDALALEVVLGRMALEPWRAPPEAAIAAAPLQRPVLLVHGFGCSGAVWRPLLARLRAAGVGPVQAVSLEPLLAGIDAYAPQLLAALETLGSRGGGRPITIVAHSMGGLVARAVLCGAPPGRVGRIITLGAPHHGTALACRFWWPSARQMCPGSGWLTELNARQEGRLGIPLTTLYSRDDNYIVPAASARLEEARSVEFQGLGHLGLLNSKAVLGRVVSELLA
jgi:triacylglycerol esterase/lipase EstA (alpha/beta hydrolase family)